MMVIFQKSEKSLEGSKVVIEKSHPVEVHTVEDHPEERVLTNESDDNLVDEDEESYESGKNFFYLYI